MADETPESLLTVGSGLSPSAGTACVQIIIAFRWLVPLRKPRSMAGSHTES
jgi:hypothetical protein